MDAEHLQLAGQLARYGAMLLAFSEGAREPTFKLDVQRVCERVWTAIEVGDAVDLERVVPIVNNLIERGRTEPRWSTATTVMVLPKGSIPGPAASLAKRRLRAVTGANL